MENYLVLVLVTIFYILLFLGGVLGNLLVCLVIIRSKELHSAMNYYLVSLALADLTLITLGKSSILRSILLAIIVPKYVFILFVQAVYLAIVNSEQGPS